MTKDEAIVLRELNHLPEWQLYCQFAKTHIRDLTEHYVRKDLTQEAAWESRVQLKAIMEYQAYMEDLVKQASDTVDQIIAQDHFRELEGKNFDAGIEY